jgi:hypothetical protein
MLDKPDKATISLALRPLREKREISVSRSSMAVGSSLSARVELAVVESLLPSFTVQDGPPTCFFQRESHQNFIFDFANNQIYPYITGEKNESYIYGYSQQLMHLVLPPQEYLRRIQLQGMSSLPQLSHCL